MARYYEGFKVNKKGTPDNKCSICKGRMRVSKVRDDFELVCLHCFKKEENIEDIKLDAMKPLKYKG